MKTLIFAITLLFSAATLAEPSTNNPNTHEEYAQFVDDSTMTGLALDPEIFFMYVSTVYQRGPEVANMKLAVKYAFCHLLWNKVLEEKWFTDNITEDMYAVTSWRSLVNTKLFVHRANRDPGEVETKMLPTLNEFDINVGAAGIAECAALDQAAVLHMEFLGIKTNPEPDEDLTPKPIEEPKAESYSS